jgi:methionyl-tRNA formyltransferase
MIKNNLKFAFWGTDDFATSVLEILVDNGFVPELVVTVPDKPKGRKLVLTSPAIKVFAEAQGIKVDQPEKLKEYTPGGRWDLFIVTEYGKIIPERLIDLPQHKTINVHPSLLPKFRGPSPIQSFMLSDEEETGVSIMLIDAEMDHGPILEIRKWKSEDRKIFNKELEIELAELGGKMLVDIIPKYINGEITPKEQNHDLATYCQKITKEAGLVDLEKDDPKTIYKKILALTPWPSVYFFTEKNGAQTRVIITDAELASDKLIIKKVKPEGKNEMSYDSWINGTKAKP